MGGGYTGGGLYMLGLLAISKAHLNVFQRHDVLEGMAAVFTEQVACDTIVAANVHASFVALASECLASYTPLRTRPALPLRLQAGKRRPAEKLD